MLKPTKYSLKQYRKAVEICAIRRGYKKCEAAIAGKGSAYSFRVYENEFDVVPANIWTVHVEHSRKQAIFPRDLKKAWENLGIDESMFMEVINNC